ncbi:zinc-ribbon domain-containing protein [Desulfovibrio sp. OttesenSCG-928-M16]|nr:zinc-ribbon domain-containing protein [Desulfovibrio sp. OttesenSCG-928-M16]
MFIACPKCETTFSLPDNLYKPGKKARCSQCGEVFPMPEQSAETAQGIGENAPPQLGIKKVNKNKLKQYAFLGIAALLLLALAYGGWLMFGPAPEKTADQIAGQADQPRQGEPDNEEEKAREALINGIALEEIRQFLVDNMVIGKIMVIQGLATNTSQGNRDYIAIEARILDDNNRILAHSSQICGVPLTLFQLQSLSEAELKESLDNRITILTNNTNVPPGGKVPFVVVFSKPPQGMRTFEVRVVDVRESPQQ